MNDKAFRSFQLKVLAIISIAIGPVVLIATTLIHRLPFPQSISETATIAGRTDSLLPFALGALALFSLAYSLRYAYMCLLDRFFTLCMTIGFTLIAFQPVMSEYILAEQVGVFGLNHQWTNIIHYVGAIIGFSSYIGWVLLCFKKSNLSYDEQTSEKRIRNDLYTSLGYGMFASLSFFVFDILGLLGDNFPVIFWTEVFILFFGGIACWVKAGGWLKDGALKKTE